MKLETQASRRVESSTNPEPHTPIISIFGSSRSQTENTEYQTAYELGKQLAEAGYTICNGGYGGIMEASARGASVVNGKSIGVVTEVFGATANPFITQTIVTKTLIDRLVKLIEIGDAYIIFRGATGTLLELAAVWEFMNKHLMKEKPILLYGAFWYNLVDTLKQELISEGLPISAGYITQVNSPSECVHILKTKL